MTKNIYRAIIGKKSGQERSNPTVMRVEFAIGKINFRCITDLMSVSARNYHLTLLHCVTIAIPYFMRIRGYD